MQASVCGFDMYVLCNSLLRGVYTNFSGRVTYYNSNTGCDTPELYGWINDAVAQASKVSCTSSTPSSWGWQVRASKLAAARQRRRRA